MGLRRILLELTAAAASRAFVGDSAADIVAPLVFLALVAASWALRPASRTLAGSTKGVVAKPERVVDTMTAAAAR